MFGEFEHVLSADHVRFDPCHPHIYTLYTEGLTHLQKCSIFIILSNLFHFFQVSLTFESNEVCESPTGDLGDIAGVKVRNGAREVSLAQISCIMMYSSSAHSSGCMVDGLSAMAAY